MGNEIYVERRRRGFFGWIFLAIFIAWNALMILWLVSAIVSMGVLIESAATDAERAGSGIGAGIATTFILIIWAAGAIVTGLLAMVTRGGKTVVTRRN